MKGRFRLSETWDVGECEEEEEEEEGDTCKTSAEFKLLGDSNNTTEDNERMKISVGEKVGELAASGGAEMTKYLRLRSGVQDIHALAPSIISVENWYPCQPCLFKHHDLCG